MLNLFRTRYPDGGLISELIQIDRIQYIVRVLVQVNGMTLASALAAADSIEEAEDKAIDRALKTLCLDSSPSTSSQSLTSHLTSDSSVTSSPMRLEKVEKKTAKKSTSKNGISHNSEIKTDKSLNSEQPIFSTEVASTSFANSQLTIEEVGKEKEDDDYTNLSQPIESPQDQANLFEEQSIAQNNSETQLDLNSISNSQDWLEQTVPETKPVPEVTEIDFAEIIAKTTIEMKRLGWTNEQGRDFLLQTYGKRSRQVLSDEELINFLHYLESQP